MIFFSNIALISDQFPFIICLFFNLYIFLKFRYFRFMFFTGKGLQNCQGCWPSYLFLPPLSLLNCKSKPSFECFLKDSIYTASFPPAICIICYERIHLTDLITFNTKFSIFLSLVFSRCLLFSNFPSSNFKLTSLKK